MPELYSFGEWVRRRRKALDLTQDAMAQQVGCALSTIKKIEADDRRPSREMAARLARYLAIPNEEHEAFLKAARAELRVDRLATPAVAGLAQQPPASIAPPRSNLPRQLTSLIGRQHELADLTARMATAPLLTLTGVGGTGKTRLALQAAAELQPAFEQGVWLVELAPLTDPLLVPQAVARVLKVREEQGRPLLETLCAALGSRRILLVLDNCEHLLDACAQLAETLLQQCARLQILATSREALGLAGEQLMAVPPLRLPEDQALPLEELLGYSAVQLFVERARAAQPAFALSLENAAAVLTLCRRLDGLPLALELAAARVPLMTPSEIAERLDQCFALLTGGSRTTLPRQRTLEAAIDWSYALLQPEERRLFRHLSVFAGGWTLAAAEAICENPEPETAQVSSTGRPVLELLANLVAKSLVLAEEQQAATRYRLLATIRHYAAGKLLESGEMPALREGHLQHYLALAEENDERRKGAQHQQAQRLLEQEHDNLRAALEWSVSAARQADAPADAALRLGNALNFFWWFLGYLQEGKEWSERIMVRFPPTAAPQTPDAERALWLQRAGRLIDFNGKLVSDFHEHERLRLQAIDVLEESLSLWRRLANPLGMAETLILLSLIYGRGEQYVLARARCEEARRLSLQAGDRFRTIRVNFALAGFASALGEHTAALALQRETLTLVRALDNAWLTASTLQALMQIAMALGDYESARRYGQESLGLSRESDAAGVAAQLQIDFGRLAWLQGQETQAEQHFEEALASFKALDDSGGRGLALVLMTLLALDQGCFARALALFKDRTILQLPLQSHQIAYERLLTAACLLAAADWEPEAAEGYAREAAVLFGAIELRLQQSGGKLHPILRRASERHTGLARQRLQAAAFATAWDEGRGLSRAQAQERALQALERLLADAARRDSPPAER